jgi:hypothetical protein
MAIEYKRFVIVLNPVGSALWFTPTTVPAAFQPGWVGTATKVEPGVPALVQRVICQTTSPSVVLGAPFWPNDTSVKQPVVSVVAPVIAVNDACVLGVEVKLVGEVPRRLVKPKVAIAIFS